MIANKKFPSETYAGFAWDYLRRNLAYGRDCDQFLKPSHRNAETSEKTVRYESSNDKLAHHWGLECFETPEASDLDAQIFWRQDAFPGALSVYYHDDAMNENEIETFKLSRFNCHKQHYVKSDGTRISVMKSQGFWLQIAGKPKEVESEDQPFSVLINGGKGARRRIDALRQLTSLSRNGSENFKLLGRQKAYSKMRNALLAYDIRANGGSYKDVAVALFGVKKVQQEWNPAGCFLKGRAVRVFKFGERMVAQDYQNLLPKKTL